MTKNEKWDERNITKGMCVKNIMLTGNGKLFQSCFDLNNILEFVLKIGGKTSKSAVIITTLS